MKDFYEGNNYELPDYQRAVCGIVKKSDGFELVNHKSTVIWKSSESENITSALSKKSKDYYSDNGEFSKQRIWIIGTKREKDTTWTYRNVASCSRGNFNVEINEHIKQLIEEGETKKAKRYFELWKVSDKIAFFEILIDKYIRMLEAKGSLDDRYFSSIIFPTEQIKDSNIREILEKNQMIFIEGELAAKYNMKHDEKKGGIWFPSGSGIDGDVYQYYKLFP